jgi:hypothetical protein
MITGGSGKVWEGVLNGTNYRQVGSITCKNAAGWRRNVEVNSIIVNEISTGFYTYPETVTVELDMNKHGKV